MEEMFGCSFFYGRTLNLSNFNTKNVNNMWKMFDNWSSKEKESIITKDFKIIEELKKD